MTQNSDIRVPVAFFRHPKTRRGVRVLGPSFTDALLKLWCNVAENRPDGNLSGMDADDIEEVAEWPTDRRGEFFDYCTQNRWIDKAGRGYIAHDWAEHQPWARGAVERSFKGRFNAHLLHHIKEAKPNPTKCDICAAGIRAMPEWCYTHAAPMHVALGCACTPHAPAPAPAPSSSSHCKTAKRSRSRDDAGSKKTKAKAQESFADDSPAMALTDTLRGCLREAGTLHTEPDRQSWARDFALILTTDGRSAEDVETVIRFVTADEKQRAYLRSPGALRSKWPDGSLKWDGWLDRAKRGPKVAASPDAGVGADSCTPLDEQHRADRIRDTFLETQSLLRAYDSGGEWTLSGTPEERRAWMAAVEPHRPDNIASAPTSEEFCSLRVASA